MSELFTIGNLMTLAMLVLLQAVLGFDNLLYVAIESKRVVPEKQALGPRQAESSGKNDHGDW